MSRAVFFKCLTCDSVPGRDFDDEWSINHGDEWLRSIWANRAWWVALYGNTTEADREQVLGYQAVEYRGRWIAEHADHDVVLRDEYCAETPLTLPKTADRR